MFSKSGERCCAVNESVTTNRLFCCSQTALKAETFGPVVCVTSLPLCGPLNLPWPKPPWPGWIYGQFWFMCSRADNRLGNLRHHTNDGFISRPSCICRKNCKLCFSVVNPSGLNHGLPHNAFPLRSTPGLRYKNILHSICTNNMLNWHWEWLPVLPKGDVGFWNLRRRLTMRFQFAFRGYKTWRLASALVFFRVRCEAQQKTIDIPAEENTLGLESSGEVLQASDNAL